MRALGPDRIDQLADLVIDQRVFHLADLIVPRPDVHRQEQLVQPVKLTLRVARRRLRAVAREMQVNEIPVLRLGRKIGKGRTNGRQRGRRGALDPIGQHDHVLRGKGHRRCGCQIGLHQFDIIGRAFQPEILFQVRIGVRPDQERVVFRQRGQGHQAQGRGKQKLFHGGQFVIRA